ncbi:MAG TPA: type IV pilus modification protein PilV [Burkholderiaceae bacterium]|nr:type IV pilus modification protein PilV [Burkholderiaceae bacterium]
MLKRNARGSTRQRGLSMIEVLVAIVIISLGLLGMAGLQAASLRGSQGAVYRSQAMQFAADMAERMRGNLGDARNYAIALGDPVPTGTTVTDLDRADWLARLATLPAGTGAIAVDTVNNVVSITVQWDDSRAGGDAQSQYTLVTRVWNN